MEFPLDFVRRIKTELGTGFSDFLLALDRPTETSIRLNPDKPSSAFDHSEKVSWHAQGRYLSERPIFTLDPLFHAGAYYVQEASSMFVSEALRQTLGTNTGLRVLDFCAAPGGKTTLLASALSDDSLILANEVIRSRIAPLQENIERWGAANVMLSNHDPDEFRLLEGFFDVILIDAPCSGEGLFRKDEAAVREWSVANCDICVSRQRRILKAAYPLLKEGGTLIYSTCTFNPEENEQNLSWLISQFALDPFRLELRPEWGLTETGLGYQFYPHKVRGEGFFIACFRKTAKTASGFSSKHSYKSLSRLEKEQKIALSSWLNFPEELEFYKKPNQEIIAIPGGLCAGEFFIAEILQRRSLGVEIGTFKGRDYIPSHRLALSTLINPVLPAVELDKWQALQFLKKENLHFEHIEKGWTLAQYQGLNLGWLKILESRTNNYLPQERKIRMDIKIEE